MRINFRYNTYALYALHSVCLVHFISGSYETKLCIWNVVFEKNIHRNSVYFSKFIEYWYGTCLSFASQKFIHMHVNFIHSNIYNEFVTPYLRHLWNSWNLKFVYNILVFDWNDPVISLVYFYFVRKWIDCCSPSALDIHTSTAILYPNGINWNFSATRSALSRSR